MCAYELVVKNIYIMPSSTQGTGKNKKNGKEEINPLGLEIYGFASSKSAKNNTNPTTTSPSAPDSSIADAAASSPNAAVRKSPSLTSTLTPIGNNKDSDDTTSTLPPTVYTVPKFPESKNGMYKGGRYCEFPTKKKKSHRRPFLSDPVHPDHQF